MLKKAILGTVIFMIVLVSGASADNSHYYNYIVKDKYVKNLCFNFSDSNDYPEWDSALKKAINKFNSSFRYNTSMNFIYKRYSGQNCSYTVNIETEYNDDPGFTYEAITYGEHYWTRKPFDGIKINLANTYTLYSSSMKEGLLMHEMMHVIGFEHKGYGSGTKVPGTSNDPHPEDSVTGGGASDYLYDNLKPQEYENIFSEYDKKAVRYLY